MTSVASFSNAEGVLAGCGSFNRLLLILTEMIVYKSNVLNFILDETFFEGLQLIPIKVVKFRIRSIEHCVTNLS